MTLYRQVKCPDCCWSQFHRSKFKDELAGMTPCDRCGSTGYKYKPVDEPKFNNALEADAHNWDTRELEPKPDEGLLTDEEIQELTLHTTSYEPKDTQINYSLIEVRKIVKTQRDLTASEKDAEIKAETTAWREVLGCIERDNERKCQARVERIFKIIDYIKAVENYPLVEGQLESMVILHFDIPDEEAKRIVQALKEGVK